MNCFQVLEREFEFIELLVCSQYIAPSLSPYIHVILTQECAVHVNKLYVCQLYHCYCWDRMHSTQMVNKGLRSTSVAWL